MLPAGTSRSTGVPNFSRRLPFLKSLLSSHPPLQKRFHDIDEKTFLREDIANLSPELAFWTEVAGASLSYNIFKSAIAFAATFGFSLTAEPTFEIFFMCMFLTVASSVAVTYMFPTTKAPLLFSDLGCGYFLLPLLRNWAISLVTAAGIYYASSLSVGQALIVMSEMLTSYFLWSMGFATSRPSHFRHGNWYLFLAPFVWCVLLWIPVGTIGSFFSGSPIDLNQFAYSMFGVLFSTIAITIFLTARGSIHMEREERLVALFGRRKELRSDPSFVLLVLLGMFLTPAVTALGIYFLSCFLDLFKIIPIKMSLLFGISSILVLYGRKKSDILYFNELHFLTDIISWKNRILYTQFIQRVLETYQSREGGFDYAGRGFTHQEDTFHAVKTAKTLGITIEEERVNRWIDSTEIKTGGFALFPGGYPRMEGLYYAVQSLSLLGMKEEVSRIHMQWVLSSFTGEYFTTSNDTCSFLLQTCYAVESLFLLGALPKNLKPCREWIEAYVQGDIKPKEAFFSTRALKILNSDRTSVYNWLAENRYVLNTRVDKNLEDIYYYVAVLHEMNETIPSLIEEQVLHRLDKVWRKYGERFTMTTRVKRRT